MKVLHVLDHSLPLQSGYVYRTLHILRQQRAHHIETFQMTTPRHRNPGPNPEDIGGLAFHRTKTAEGILSQFPGVGEAREMAATEHCLAEICAEHTPDIIHAHSPVLSVIPALRVGRRFAIPVVYEVRAFWEDAAVIEGRTKEGSAKYHLSRWLEMRALRKADAVIAICEGIRQDLLRRGLAAEKITLVPNAVDNARFAAAKPRDMKIAQSLGLEGTFVLGFIGSFYRYEGLDLLLQAFGSLRDSLPSARLLLVGGGPEEAVLLEKSRALGLEDRVKFLGRVPNEAIEAYYGLLDLAVYPRRTSRLTELVTPLKPLEAMAYGIPVLASAVGGHRELIEDRKTGHLFAADSVDALCCAILAAARKPDVLTLTAEAAKDYVTKQRDWAVVAANYVDFYRDLVR